MLHAATRWGLAIYMVSTATPGDGVARASKFAVKSKYELGRGDGETRGSSKRHGLGHTLS